MQHSIKVIGAGIAGLSCAVQLQQAGYGVEIISKEKPEQTTSAAAAGIWLPFHAGDHPRTAAWAKTTYDYCREMQKRPETGIFFINHCAYTTTPGDIDAAIRGADGFHIFDYNELKYEAVSGFSMRIPVMPSDIILPFLADKFSEQGGRFFWREVEDLAEESKSSDLMINCAGYGAKKLCQDESLKAAKGHVLVMPNPEIQNNIVFTEKRHFTHIFPYGDYCIVGGIYDEGNTDLKPEESITKDILGRVSRLEPAFKNLQPLAIRTGLRPVRPSVRLEMEALPNGKAVVHNYGHGGAGFTLAHGCAVDVVKMAHGYFGRHS